MPVGPLSFRRLGVFFFIIFLLGKRILGIEKWKIGQESDSSWMDRESLIKVLVRDICVYAGCSVTDGLI
jgi:hypothetical protein